MSSPTTPHDPVDTAAAAVPGLSLTGSYLDGVGIPACIGRARATVAALTS